jgi:hypothetical protein
LGNGLLKEVDKSPRTLRYFGTLPVGVSVKLAVTRWCVSAREK